MESVRMISQVSNTSCGPGRKLFLKSPITLGHQHKEGKDHEKDPMSRRERRLKRFPGTRGETADRGGAEDLGAALSDGDRRREYLFE